MAFEKTVPEWNAPGAEPPSTLKQSGWEAGQKPPSDYFNWFWHGTSEALKEIQAMKPSTIGAAETGHAHAAATSSSAGFLSAADKTKLDGIAAGANKTTIANNLTTATAGSALDAAQGKALNDALSEKAELSHSHSASDIVSGTLPVSRGGTGAATAAAACVNLGAAPLASPAFTGAPKAPAAATDYTTYRLRNMALVSSAPTSAIGNGQLVGVYS